MFRVYLKDKSFYDVNFGKENSLYQFIDFALTTLTNMVILKTTSGEVAINKDSIVKIIKL